MDAKPQRIRVRGDENAPFPAVAGKTIHQQNKSTPALSALYQNGVSKPTTKRAAFGDVSNTSKPVNASRDDASLAGRKQSKAAEKPSVVIEKRSTVLAQPAQRPGGMKGILSNVTNVAHAKSVEPSKQAANTRKTLNKRATIFKDTSKAQAEKCENTSKETKKEAKQGKGEPSLAHAPIAPAKQDGAKEETQSDEVQDPVVGELEEHAVVTSAVVKDDKESSKLDDDVCEVQGVRESREIREEVGPAGHDISDPATKSHRESVSSSHVTHDRQPAQAEFEDYWDDEEEENEDDDGYITARSYRSRGENTTGGATTVLFPKYTQQVRRELALAQQVVEATRTEEDIEDEFWDTSMVAEYSEEIFEYMREQEIKLLPNAHYMDNQAEIQWSMRSVLMDWLVQVHHRFSLLPETLFLCVNYIDRFLSCKIVSLNKLQLVGATAIFIAAKYEEINCPSIQEIVYMVDGGYSADEILKAEWFMLSMLQFELGCPGPMSFLRRISKADDYDLETRTLAKYFLEITIMDERFVGSPASFVAAGAHCLARLMLRKGDWTPAHTHYAGYTYSQLLPLISLMMECCERPSKHHAAIYEKYTDKRYKRASLFVEAEMKRGFLLPDNHKDTSVFRRNSTLEAGHYCKKVNI
ncbi:cyclin family protein [Aspergillus aculeatinus CBS 121060]|uniref:G2/mitotic-specific cyclin n=1 Tax=Aspergillus aculeatinus CBS 121060 TaxID=1448322 RepID=A0ACD1H229_9EURO|nr:G2/mitotic-specific cyclin [Aspergillus aculeatinus CBS 121060]RAH67642.1 G2/mitotic-specific cyclin [Aspergillus aculeatinus CBS 121060]